MNSDMPATPPQEQPQRSHLLACTLLYLLLPNILFLAGWVQTWVAVPLSLLLAWMCFSLWKNAPRRKMQQITLGGWCIILLIPALMTWCIGFDGSFPQTLDFVVRNAVYASLVNDSWPLHSAQGEYFVYYHAFWLPPAALVKLTGLPAVPVLMAWVYAGLVLFTALLYRRLRGWTAVFMLLLVLLGNAHELVLHQESLAKYIPVPCIGTDFFSQLELPNMMTWNTGWMQILYTYNQAIAILVFLALYLSRLLDRERLLLAAPLVVCASPIASLAVAIFLACLVRPQGGFLPRLLKNPQLYIDTVLLLLLGLYFGSGPGSECCAVWQASANVGLSAAEVGGLYLLSVLPMLGMLLLFGWRFRYTAGFTACMALTVTLPAVWVGLFNNEALFKGSGVVFFFVCYFLLGAWRHAERNFRVLLAAVLCAAAVIPSLRLQHHLRDLTFSLEQRALNIHNEWQGHLNHPEHPWYSQFWGAQAPPLFRK